MPIVVPNSTLPVGVPVTPEVTPDQYADYTGQPNPDNIAALLRSAGRLVARDTKTAIYATDDNGQPTDPNVALAMRDAIFEQVASWQAAGVDPSAGGLQAKGLLASKNLDGSAVSYDNTLTTSAGAFAARQAMTATLCEQSVLVLEQAGLTSSKVWNYG